MKVGDLSRFDLIKVESDPQKQIAMIALLMPEPNTAKIDEMMGLINDLAHAGFSVETIESAIQQSMDNTDKAPYPNWLTKRDRPTPSS